MNKEIYIDILVAFRMPSQGKAPKSGEPAVGLFSTTMLQHTSQFGSMIS